MSWLKTIWRELIGLFIDDGSFAVAIVVWLAAVAAISRFAEPIRPWTGLMIFAGLAAILAESALRRARK